MNRRAILSAIPAVVAGGLAGCVSGGGDGAASRTDTDSPTEEAETATETDTDEETSTHGECDDATASTDGPVELVDSTLAVTDTGCGEQHDSARVCFQGEAGAVLVDGIIWGSDTCDRPFLEETHFDGEADELVVTVTTRHPESEETPACGQCITELGYRARVAFDGGLPGAVTVRHSHGPGSNDVVAERQR